MGRFVRQTCAIYVVVLEVLSFSAGSILCVEYVLIFILRSWIIAYMSEAFTDMPWNT